MVQRGEIVNKIWLSTEQHGTISWFHVW